MTTTILIIDDSEDDRLLYRRAFKDFEGFSLVMATSAADGLAHIADATRPDLILLDYNLPDMDGLGFMKKLAATSDTSIPIIMLTGASNPSIAVEAMKNGVDDYIVKDAGGQYLKLLPGVVSHVMAAHEQREESLRLKLQAEALQARNQALMQNSMDGIHVMDVRGNLVDANNAFCLMLGYSREEALRLNVADWDARWSAEELHERFKNHLVENARFETVHRRKDGSLIDVEISTSAMEIEGQYLIFATSHDITERKRDEEKLKLSAQLLNSTTDTIFLLDLDGNFVYLNEAAWKSRGYTRDEMMSMNLREFNTPEFRKIIAPRIKEILENGGGLFEAAHICKDGSIIPVEINSRLIESNGRKLMLAVVRDITERRRTEGVLKLNKTIIENAYDGFWRYDTNGYLIEVNQAYADMVGYTREELAGMHISKLSAQSATPELVKARIEKAINQGPGNFETRHRHKDGHVMDFEASIAYIPEADCLFSFIRDVTERKKSEAVLRRHKQVVDTSLDGFWVNDLNGNLLEANEAYAKMSGYSVEELAGMQVGQLEAKEQAADIEAHIAVIFEQGYDRFITRHRRKDGREIDVEVSATYMEEPQQIFAFFRDITERKRAEAMLQKSEANLRAMLDNSPYLTWLKDTEGRYITINKIFADYLRLKNSSQAAGLTDLDLQPKELAEKYRADDAEVMASRRQKHVEESAFDGKNTHWVETFKSPVMDEQGNVLGTVGFARDVTKRKQNEEALRVAAITFETHDAIVITDADANIIRVNRAFTDITGYSPEEVLGKNPRIMSSRAHDRSFYAGMWRQLLDTGTWSGEIWDKRKNGEIYPKWMTITAIKNERHETVQYIAISSDITTRVKAEEELLRESDERFRGTLEQAAVGIAHADLEGAFKQINRKLSEILGYSSLELIQLGVEEITLHEDLDKDRDFILQILAGKISTYSVEKRLVRKNQTLVWANLTVSMLHNSDGSPKYFIYVVEDITERKAAENKIIRLSNLHAAISRANEAIVKIADRDTLLAEICRIAVEFGRFKLAWIGLIKNPTRDLQIIASAGEATEYLTNLNISTDGDKLEGRGPTGVAIRDNRVYICNDFFNDPCTIPWRENARKHEIHSDASCPLELDGEVVGALTLYAGEINYFDQEMTNLLIVLAKDISVALSNFVREDRRRRAEFDLRESRQLLRELAAQSEALLESERKHIAREIHDELGQILTALRMDVALLRIQSKGQDAELLEKTQSMTALLDQAIQGVRNVATNLRPAVLDLGIVAAIEWLRDEFVRHTGVSCALNFSGEFSGLDEGLAVVIFRIAQESLTNVARHSDATDVAINLVQDADKLHMTIQDNGKGFDPDDIANRKSFGLLGMSERAIALDGTFKITSKPLRGTSVSVSIPTRLTGDIS